MEFVWMMAESNDAEWISRFNKRMMDYADDGILRGAYGWRWANPTTQISDTIALLRDSPDTRQAVLSMWDPTYDNAKARTSDRPCNTHIYLRIENERLNMTVCNRSNDLFWGMLGSNAVHMTMLHELISLASGVQQGIYRVFTNNLHVYTEMPRFEEIYKKTFGAVDPYSFSHIRHTPLLDRNETFEQFQDDCRRLVDNDKHESMQTHWMENVALPMYDAYLDREYRNEHIKNIDAQDWHLVCHQWVTRRAGSD